MTTPGRLILAAKASGRISAIFRQDRALRLVLLAGRDDRWDAEDLGHLRQRNRLGRGKLAIDIPDKLHRTDLMINQEQGSAFGAERFQGGHPCNGGGRSSGNRPTVRFVTRRLIARRCGSCAPDLANPHRVCWLVGSGRRAAFLCLRRTAGKAPGLTDFCLTLCLGVIITCRIAAFMRVGETGALLASVFFPMEQLAAPDVKLAKGREV